MSLLLERAEASGRTTPVLGATSDTLEAHLAYWQRALRIQDWDIEAEYADAEELENGKRGGECAVCQPKRKARIKILAEEFRPRASWFEHDEELTLVHELLHILTWAWPATNEGQATDDEEIAIHRISEALVKLKREGQGR